MQAVIHCVGYKNDLTLQEQRVKRSNPYKEEMDEQEQKIKELGERQLALYKDSAEKQNEIDRIINDVAIQRKDLEMECEREITAIESEIKLVFANIAKLDDMLSRQKGSFMEWLTLNKPGWENNIGKVLDEDAVLYILQGNQENGPVLPLCIGRGKRGNGEFWSA